MKYTLTYGSEVGAVAHRADTTADAVAKAEHFEAQGHKVTIRDHDGVKHDLHSLRLALQGNR